MLLHFAKCCWVLCQRWLLIHHQGNFVPGVSMSISLYVLLLQEGPEIQTMRTSLDRQKMRSLQEVNLGKKLLAALNVFSAYVVVVALFFASRLYPD